MTQLSFFDANAKLLRHSVLAASASLFLIVPAFAQIFEGNNSSSEFVQIALKPNGIAEVYWYPAHLGGKVSIRENWNSSIEGNGFKLLAPGNSLLLKINDSIVYSQISSNSNLVHCAKGCAVTMPNLMGRVKP
jgi:hypothetical protein